MTMQRDAFPQDDELEDSESVIPTSDDEGSADGLTGTERYEGWLEAGVDPTGNAATDDLGSDDLRIGETFDPNLAAEEGLTYVPPVDPVVTADPDSREGVRVAAGIGVTAFDEPFDADHHGEVVPAEDEVTARVREALRADASTTALADRLEIDTEGGVVRFRGMVDDLTDSDAIEAVASEVEGVVEVRDETEVRGL